MDVKEVLEYVLAHPVYYLTMGILLITLIYSLVSLRKRRYERKDVREGRQSNANRRHIPKYAAGDEMDRVRKRSYFQEEPNHPPIVAVILVICVTLAVCSYIKYPEERKISFVIFFQTIQNNSFLKKTRRFIQIFLKNRRRARNPRLLET